jgi:DNA-binding NarL/FixJ family response regulator
MTANSTLPQVLFIDDEPRVLDGLRDLLRPRPYRLRFATSAHDALATLREEPADVMVTDERMPGLAGSELCAIVAREFPSTQRLLLTAHATIDVAMRAINEGRVAAFLLKPVKAVELDAAVERAIHLRQLEVAKERFVRAAVDLAKEGTYAGGAMLEGPHATRTESRAPNVPSIAVGGFDGGAMRLLSAREREVFDLLAEGYRVSQIAKMLFRSQHTVRNHLKAIFDKLDVNSQEALIARARSAPGR